MDESENRFWTERHAELLRNACSCTLICARCGACVECDECVCDDAPTMEYDEEYDGQIEGVFV